jgi:hypothetical protein
VGRNTVVEAVCCLIRDEASLHAVLLGDSEQLGEVHSGEEFGEERGPVPASDLLLGMIPDDLSIFWRGVPDWSRFRLEVLVVPVVMRPETFAKTRYHRLHQRTVWMVGQQPFESIDPDRGADLKEIQPSVESVVGDRIKEEMSGRRRKRRGRER